MKTIFLMMVGYSLSGKTTIVKQIAQRYPKRFFVLDTRPIHDYLNTIDIFQDDNSVNGPAYQLRQDSTDAIQDALLSTIGKKGISVISNSCNQVKKERKERLSLMKRLVPNMKSVILFVYPNENLVLERAKKEDEALIVQGKKPVWMDLHKKQIERMEFPTKEEANYLLEYNGNNLEEILSELEKIIN
ncbi:ATP-binding protein [Candidatus Dojkabacteria bacterium]|nr:ATP-binding protein [Candidatus Dojkabacteria bacterium]